MHVKEHVIAHDLRTRATMPMHSVRARTFNARMMHMCAHLPVLKGCRRHRRLHRDPHHVAHHQHRLRRCGRARRRAAAFTAAVGSVTKHSAQPTPP
eukprot:6205905-Pleurochrysis_carterae.AAC.1